MIDRRTFGKGLGLVAGGAAASAAGLPDEIGRAHV